MFLRSDRFLRHKDSFPAGCQLGIDSSHIALRGGGQCRLSVAAFGTSSSVTQIAPSFSTWNHAGVGSADLFTKIDPVLGPIGYSLTSNHCYTWTSGSITETQFTMGAIFVAGTAAGSQCVFGDANFQAEMYVKNNVLTLYSGGNFSSGITINADTPYFCALSSANGGTLYFIAKNLATGQVFTGSLAGPATWGSVGGGWQMCSDGASLLLGGVATACATSASLGPADLLQWSESIWDFWLPEIDLQPFVGVAASPPPPGFVPAVPFFSQLWMSVDG